MNTAAARVADATGNWVDTHAPRWSRPYLGLSRLDRPIGSWLLLMPCWWSAALAIGDIGQLPLIIALFFIGAFAMRGAGCTWNDITDRDLDAKVERTRSRPIPAGQVSVAQAAAFLVAQALIGLAVLLQFNRFAVATGVASLVIVARPLPWTVNADPRWAKAALVMSTSSPGSGGTAARARAVSSNLLNCAVRAALMS